MWIPIIHTWLPDISYNVHEYAWNMMIWILKGVFLKIRVFMVLTWLVSFLMIDIDDRHVHHLNLDLIHEYHI